MTKLNSETVLVTGADLKPEAVDLLESHNVKLVYSGDNPPNTLLCKLASDHTISGLIVRHGDIDESVLTASSQLRVIANHGAGYDNIDANAAARLGIPLFIAKGRNATSVAEHALMLMLALHKNLRLFDSEVRRGSWHGSIPAPTELSEKTLGIVGFGATGRELARLFEPFGGKIIVFDPVSTSIVPSERICIACTCDELLTTSDIVSLHVPLTQDTHNFINQERLSLFKPGAMLINTSRGGVVDESALAAALKSGALSAAGLDTFTQEPLPLNHPFATLQNVLLTPHLGGVTSECLIRMSLATAENVLCVLRGTPENDGDRIC